MIYIVLVLVGVLLIMSFVIYVLATRREHKATGQPTPEEARIKKEQDEITQKILITAERDRKEIENASKPDLLKRLRGLLVVRKP